MGKITSFRESGRRYTALRVIGFLFTLIGVILLAIGGGLLGYGLYVLASGGASAAAPPPNPEAFPGPQVINVPFPWPMLAGLSLLWSCRYPVRRAAIDRPGGLLPADDPHGREHAGLGPGAR